ncbi:hypothetical protein FOZ63_003682, partial [Perkinsus olseni]
MNFDGHIINLAVDTASYKSYLVYGGWYESLYGPGSCKYLISVCYFCPLNDPCERRDSLPTHETLMEERNDRCECMCSQGCIDVVVDTCADATVVPDKVFSMIWAAVEVEFGRDRVDGSGKALSTKSRKLAAYVDAKGWIWFRKSVIERLPVVAVQVHAASSFEVHLSNHVQVCDGGPFFVDHDVHIDLDSGVIGLVTPGSLVVKEIASPES